MLYTYYIHNISKIHPYVIPTQRYHNTLSLSMEALRMLFTFKSTIIKSIWKQFTCCTFYIHIKLTLDATLLIHTKIADIKKGWTLDSEHWIHIGLYHRRAVQLHQKYLFRWCFKTLWTNTFIKIYKTKAKIAKALYSTIKR